MGTWGPHPFENDHAWDLFAELAELSDGEKAGRLQKIFEDVIDNPADMASWPVDAMVGATLIALALPGGTAVEEYLTEDDAEDDWRPAMLPEPSPELIFSAARALRIVTAPGGWWKSSWFEDEDRIAALGHVQVIADVLQSGFGTPLTDGGAL
ncbi:DUF4259 domain-containing protein [Catellatospora aurea]|uniref:DUF4259 domain-containing protein n=1 Tax=Catellatospora aurea TaxID=1337874 RepID=A0ABW2HAJ5_9ACTN